MESSLDTKIAKAFITAIMILLCTVTAGTIFGFQTKTQIRNEQRMTAEFPKWNMSAMLDTTYAKSIDAFIQDHFFSRPTLIEMKHFLDRTFFNMERRDLVKGSHGYVFTRFIVDRYRPETQLQFPMEKWKRALSELHALCKKQGKILIFQSFRNGPYLYSDYLPEIWQRAMNLKDTPLQQLGKWLGMRGVVVLDHTKTMRWQREKGIMVYTPLEENHPSPETFFVIFQQMVAKLAELSRTDIKPPDDFEKIAHDRIYMSDYSEYIHKYFVMPKNTDFHWQVKNMTLFPPNKMQGALFENHSTQKNVLPSTVIYGDSFVQVMADVFGEVTTPYFRDLVVHWWNSSTTGWADATFVIVTFSDQTYGGWELIDDLVKNLKKLPEYKSEDTSAAKP